MADLKISQLTGATTPLAGTEVLPIVQSGSTVKVAVSDLTAGRAVAMAGGSFTDNITQSTAAKGVNFTANTPAAGMTSQLLNWYEEGTWTPTQGGGLTIVGSFSATGSYVRVGNLVTVFALLLGSTSIAVNAGTVMCGGIPFSAKVTPDYHDYQGSMINGSSNVGGTCYVNGGNNLIYAATTFAASGAIQLTLSYRV